MFLYILKRLPQIIVVLFIASIIMFCLIRLTPGDPALKQLGVRAKDPRLEETLKAIRKDMGLDKPIIIQYGIWLTKVAKLDFGVSARNNVPVIELIKQKMPASFELILGGILFGSFFSIIFGVSSALLNKSAWDRTIGVISQIGISIPTFWLGLLLIIVFSLKFKLLPPSGYESFLKNPIINLKHLILPALSLGVFEVGVLTRFIKSETLEVLRQEYIKVAKSKGLPKRTIILRHILKNSLIPFITALGIEVGSLIGNTVVIEQLFGWPGIGWLLFNAINNRDYALLQGIIIVIAISFAFINLIVDISYAYLNPRITYINEK